MKSIEQTYSERARSEDNKDSLKDFRSRFKTDEKLIYLDGNSLGMMPLESERLARDLISNEWGERLIRGWNENWWHMPGRVSEKMSVITGCSSDEMVVCDSTSVNLYKLVSASLRFNKGRKKILSDNLNFPSDLYVIQGVIDNLDDGHYLEMAESRNDIDIEIDDLFRLIDKNTAVVVLSYVSFRSAYMYDMKRVTDYAHKHGALIIWDLSHATGAVEINLRDAGADMAVGCTYKYLNGGPGSPAFMYVKRELHDDIISPIWAWLGEKNPFEFSLDYRSSAGAHRYMTGSPNILSMCTLEPSLDIIMEAGMEGIREKSIKLTGFLTELFYEFLEPLGFRFGSPSDPQRRGSHISLKHAEAYRICKALIDEGTGEHVVIPDFRPPDNIRLGLAPLYNGFEEVLKVVLEIHRIVEKNIYEKFNKDSESVT